MNRYKSLLNNLLTEVRKTTRQLTREIPANLKAIKSIKKAKGKWLEATNGWVFVYKDVPYNLRMVVEPSDPKLDTTYSIHKLLPSPTNTFLVYLLLDGFTQFSKKNQSKEEAIKILKTYGINTWPHEIVLQKDNGVYG